MSKIELCDRCGRIAWRTRSPPAKWSSARPPCSRNCWRTALDAGAGRVEVDVEEGGTRLCRVRDNGAGMDAEDLPLSLARHATSKIRSLEDLEQVGSLGFRGEALASISSVSRLGITSTPTLTAPGPAAECEGGCGRCAAVKPAGIPGTTVEVRDLFFNTPARRKFLRTEKTEFGHLEEVVKRQALSRFDVAFHLRHNNRRSSISSPPATRRLRASAGSPPSVGRPLSTNRSTSKPISARLKLWGWVGLPTFSRSQADLQHFFRQRPS